jgi:Cu/Ag efflux pump CusA
MIVSAIGSRAYLLYALSHFRSAKEAALIFTAIPMSAIGGVFALLLRECHSVFRQVVASLRCLVLQY